MNLLREGIDLPEVSLVAILDADKEGFLRSQRSLIQTAGRAARNINGLVIMYADTITESMQKTIDETQRHRIKQMAYNEQHHITPQPIVKEIHTALPTQTKNEPIKTSYEKAIAYHEQDLDVAFAADPIVKQMTRQQLEKSIANTTILMKEAAKELNFLQAAQYRDEIIRLTKELESK